MDPRPFTVIGGFLGAGKTTLVNHILGASTGTRYAVLVNDFGAINVDARLIAAHEGQTMALTNGCICCSMADGFIQTMLRLMANPATFDHVIVEASGVAEPDRIMDFARLDPLLAPDAILVLADAETVAERLDDPKIGDITARQIASADMLLLNKTDLAPDLDAVEDRLRRINAVAPLLRCRHAALPLDVLLGTGLASAAPARHDPGAAPPFHTATVRSAGPVERKRFEDWARGLPGHVLRGKGLVSFAGERHAHLWQRVGARDSLTASDRRCGQTEIVLIGTEPLDGCTGALRS